MGASKNISLCVGLLALLLFAVVSSGGAQTQTGIINVESLLHEMIDLDRLIHAPAVGEFNAQSSSYDRASRIENGRQMDWFANRDAGHFIRDMEVDGRTERVMADIKGPGAIVRIWSANPRGTLRIYLDGSTKPAIERDFASLFSGELGYPFVEPFAGMRARGANLYFPIPFAKSALVTCEGPGNLYYHVNHRLFPAGKRVETFSLEAAQRVKPLADVVAARLSDPYTTWRAPAGSTSRQIHWKVNPGENVHLDLSGPASIVALQLRPIAADLEKALRDAVIKITWEDFGIPSVWAPLGDFFGSGPGVNPYKGLPTGMLDTGMMYSHWVMPFAKNARIEVLNEGPQSITIYGRVITQPIQWSGSMMHFHAKWRTEHPIPTRPIIDWGMLLADGPGRFVGTSLSVANPSKKWWGEGDEKFYVDWEEFPSTFGTGTEDYFGYAWGNTGIFSHAYINQPRADGPQNYGHISNNRFHILDDVPFQKSFRFDMEVWHWDEHVKVGYSAISYWYSRAVNQDFYRPVSVSDRQILYLPQIVPYVEPGAIEGEDLEIVSVSAGKTSVQNMGLLGEHWSGHKQLWWTEASPGAVLELKLPVQLSGRYKVEGAFTKAKDYGRVQLYLAGKKLGDVMDLYRSSGVHSGKITLGELDLERGDNILKVEIVGTNDASVGDRYMFGLDYIKLVSLTPDK